MPEETFDVTDLPKPIDMLFAALTVVLIVLGAVLIVATEDPTPHRLPVVPAHQLISYSATREG